MRKLNPELALKINNSLIFIFLNKFLNCPNIDDCQNILSEHENKYESGLTKAWA